MVGGRYTFGLLSLLLVLHPQGISCEFVSGFTDLLIMFFTKSCSKCAEKLLKTCSTDSKKLVCAVFQACWMYVIYMLNLLNVPISALSAYL